MNVYVPFLIIVASNSIYHVCAKSAPTDMSSWATLFVTYSIGAIISLAVLLIQMRSGTLHEMAKSNWAVVLLGIASSVCIS